MPRSAIDATRFTPTTPHASAKPSINASSRVGKAFKAALPPRTPGSPGETPLEKVARLRAAAARAREAQFTTADRVVSHGRVWADRLHVFTARSLIALTGVATVVTVYTIGDMMLHNRRKRREYFEEQKAAQDAQQHDARAALASGTASEAQVMFLDEMASENRQVSEQAVTKPENERNGILKSAWSWLTSDLKKEEEDGAAISERRLGYENTNEKDDVSGMRESDVLRTVEEKKSEIQEKARRTFEMEKELQRGGGPLDRIGTGPGITETQKQGGWTSFMSRK